MVARQAFFVNSSGRCSSRGLLSYIAGNWLPHFLKLPHSPSPVEPEESLMSLITSSASLSDTNLRDREKKEWYALKVYFNKVFDIEKVFRLEPEDIEIYIPCKNVKRKTKEGTAAIVHRPLVSSLMFIRTTEPCVRRLQYDHTGRFRVYSRPGTKLWEPAPIPERELNMFRQVCSVGDEGLELIEYNAEKFSKGQRVKVIGGPFEGTEGRIVRIKGDHRLIVEIQGVCAVATSYIPQCFLQKLEG